MKNILVIGSINTDFVIHTDKVPLMGETVGGWGFTVNAGGKGANQAVAAARLGARVEMLGCVGEDASGGKIIGFLQESGVGTEGIQRCGGSTGTAVITVAGGDNCIILDQGANLKLDCRVVEQNRERLQWADIVILQFEIPVDTVLYAARLARELGKMTIINPAPMKAVPQALFAYTDLLVPNETEARALLGREINPENAEEALRQLQSMGCKNSIITLGDKGCVYTQGKEIRTQNAVTARAVDTTAAGDCFIGALAAALAEGHGMAQAVRFAAHAAAITVSREGAAKSLPRKDEVLAGMNEDACAGGSK